MSERNGRAALSWILYDFANTIFSMNVVSTYFALWITVDNGLDDFWVGFANSLSMLLVALSLPVLGVLSDLAGRKIPYLIAMTLICCSATGLMGGAGLLGVPGTRVAVAGLILFVVANYAYQGGLVFYNALLPAVSTRWSIGRVSGYGVAAGYLGAIIGLMMVEPFVTGRMRGIDVPLLMGEWETVRVVEAASGFSTDRSTPGGVVTEAYRILTKTDGGRESVTRPDSIRLDSDGTRRIYWESPSHAKTIPGQASEPARTTQLQKRREGYGRTASFLPTAVLFLLFSLPAFRFIREERAHRTSTRLGERLRHAAGRIREAIVDTATYPGVRRFLVAKYLYEDAISTVIIFMAVYSVKVMGMGNEELVTFFIISTTSAMVGGFLAGLFLDRITARRTLELTLCAWTLCLIAVALVSHRMLFWILGSVVGVCLGSTWTSARPFFITLVPEEMLGEFFGLYSFSGKVASIIGPLLWGIIVYVLSPYGTLAYRVAVLSLAFMAFSGFLILRGIPRSAA